jgi:4-hydroxy-tetrahydrodipicolinate reductase
MNIAIIGYGKMGHEIEEVARERNHNIGLIIDLENAPDLNASNLAAIDVVLEFSTPLTAADNIITCLSCATPVVSGTTGWLDRLDELMRLTEKQETALFYASNFSIGVNLMFEINKRLAALMQPFPQYEAVISETHHTHKVDAPSGTAISIAEQILEHTNRYEKWGLEDHSPGVLPVTSIREGEVKGIHHVTWESDVDLLTLSHHAKSRKAFAIGAVRAAEFLENRKGVFGMKDLLNL